MVEEEAPVETQPRSEAEGRLPRVDWRRTLVVTAPFVAATASLAALAEVYEGAAVGEAAIAAWALIVIFGLPVVGFWLGRKSRTSALLGPAIFGMLVGTASGVAVGLSDADLGLRGSLGLTAVFAVFGAVFAAGAGAVASGRLRRRAKTSRVVCPQCSEGIPELTLTGGLSPLWISCVACGAGLAGNRAVQVFSILNTLVAGAALLFGIYVGAIAAIVSGKPLIFFLGITSAIVVALPLTIAVRIAESLILRGGRARYAVATSGQRVPLLVRTYLVSVGVLSIVMLSFLVLYAEFSTGGETVLVSSAFVPFLLLFPIYETELGGRARKTATSILLVWAGTVLSFSAIFAIYAGYNFPKQGPFTEELELTPRKLSEYDAWREFMVLSWDESADRETKLQFFADNVISVPDEDFEFRLLPTTRVPNLVGYSALPEQELEEIRALIDQRDSAEANARYVSLWRVVDNIATGNVGLIQPLVAAGISAELIDFHLDGDTESLGPVANDVALLSASLEVKLRAQFLNSMTHEYLVWSSVIKNFEEWVCILTEIQALSQEEPDRCDWEIKWPFWDQDRSLLNAHTYFVGLVDLYRKPFHLLGGDIEDFANLESSLTSPTFADFLLSPFLTAVQATFVPNLDQFVVRKTQATARIAAFRFILEATESGRLGEVPVDPLTGESFVLTSKGDEYEIASGYLQGGEPAVRYEFRLP